MRRKSFFAFFSTLVFTFVLTSSISTHGVSLTLPEFETVKRTQTTTGFNLGSANEAKLIEVLKASGEIPQDATLDEAYGLVKQFLRNKAETYPKQQNEEQIASITNEYSEKLNDGRKIGQIQNVSAEGWDGSVRTDKVLVVLIDFADYKHNSITPYETDMYYPEYTKEHYQDMIFGENGYVGPNGQQFMSMKQYYEEQSGGSYTIDGEIAGWYTASNNAAYYGGNIDDNDARPRDLVYEALTKVANDPNVDLKDYDVFDRYDIDGDGNQYEPDGIIDHLMVVHAGVGEEAGGGNLGDDAIWSHRWNLAGAGRVVPIPGSTANVGYWGGAMTAMDYTIEPEDGAMGVFAHEFGHDLGLPDEYDIMYSGNGEPVSYWSIMAGGSWAGAIRGTEPTSFSPYAKEYLQATMPGSNWFKPLELDLEDLTASGTNVILDQATTKGDNYDAVKINLPSEKVINEPSKGEYQYFGGAGNDLFNMMYTPVDLRGRNTATLTFDAWYRIEADWDYGYVVVFDAQGNLIGTAQGNITTNSNPNGSNYFGNGITGFSYGWEKASFDLTPYVGQQVVVGFLYMTDTYTFENGLYVDDIVITADNQPLVKDGAETTPSFYLDGFTKVQEGKVETNHYYLIEWRNHQGSDAGLAHINLGTPTFLEFEPGMLVWYVDNNFDYNLVGLTPGDGFLGVVDADQTVVKRSDGYVFPMTEMHIHDATFGLEKESELFWDFGRIQYFDDSILAKRVFDDSNDYTNPDLRDAGRNIPMNYGINIRVMGESDDRSVGQINISLK